MTINNTAHAFLRRPRARRKRTPLVYPEVHEIAETAKVLPIQTRRHNPRRKHRRAVERI